MPTVKKMAFVLGDALILYFSLICTLFIRYDKDYFNESLRNHFLPFSLIFIFWLLVFYLADLYRFQNFHSFRRPVSLLGRISVAVVISSVVSVIIFYLFGDFFKLTPKTNLLIFSGIFLLLNTGWRLLLGKIFASNSLKTMVIGSSPLIDEIIEHLEKNPEIGYQIAKKITEERKLDLEELTREIITNEIQLIIIQPSLTKKFSTLNTIYRLLPLEISIINSWNFYEIIFNKTPIGELNEEWFVANIAVRRPIYDFFKRLTDFFLAAVLSIIFLIPGLIISALIKLTSAGPAVYKQERMGKNNEIFILYKFRTMRENETGALWTEPNDSRITPIGKFLRATHLDEMPQLANILKNNASFIGPRAERKELVEKYRQFAYYDIRHLIKPGITGWAQINFRPSASMEDAYEKLCYDIYYLKNRSFILDILILLKTLRNLFGLNNH